MTEKFVLKFGLDTFGDMTIDDEGKPQSAAAVLRNVVAQGVLADSLGIDHFNVGEHHRDDFSVSAPDTVLAGLATVTKNITLGTGVTVLSSEDPIRVYQRFATRIGSSLESTVTPVPRVMFLVTVARPASTVSGADTEKSSRWCSPTLKWSMPSLSLIHISEPTRRS